MTRIHNIDSNLCETFLSFSIPWRKWCEHVPLDDYVHCFVIYCARQISSESQVLVWGVTCDVFLKLSNLGQTLSSIQQSAFVHKSVNFSTANCKTISIGGSRGGAPDARPLWVQILSFWHAKFLKRSRLGDARAPPYEVHAPLREILDPPLISNSINHQWSLIQVWSFIIS